MGNASYPGLGELNAIPNPANRKLPTRVYDSRPRTEISAVESHRSNQPTYSGQRDGLSQGPHHLAANTLGSESPPVATRAL
ncbi:hypothetical protein ACKKBF_B16080 [Auxenochlorella protothecoides x Auxenochlorella symbiontica]